ncbi:MAG TPA: 50S ribosomal protein L15 [Candidatus Acidoferrum sp.]|nr:50S ribosomal protein L15 [Candidatus Acidoferrum sp.]
MAKKKTASRPRKRGQHKPATPASKDRRAFTLADLHPPAGSRIRKVRVGRGIGSKLGKTSGSGNKGQKSRRGYSRRRGFEGGQMPLHRRIPKRGFHNLFGVKYSVVNLEELNVFPTGETVTPDLLRAHGFVRRAADPVKILGDGELKNKLAIHAHAFSASAKEKIAKAGGTFEVVAS